jgi:glycosyltransferase involved in cell wall biosynthesis
MEYLGTNKEINEIKPKVSICIQVYNNENYISECLDSILNQKTKFSYEVIIGEDDSTDRTRDICKSYAEKHQNKIRLFLRSKEDKIKINDRITSRFNFISNLNSARGEYISLCDGDDFWIDLEKLDKQVTFLEENNNYALTFCNGIIDYSNTNYPSHSIYSNLNSEKTPYQKYKEPEDTTDIETLGKRNYIHSAGVVFRNWVKDEGIPDYLRKVTIGDWPLHMKTATKGLIKYMPEEMFCYRVHADGLFSSKPKKEKIRLTLGQFQPMLESDIFDEKTRSVIIDYCIRNCTRFLYKCETEEDFSFLERLILSLNIQDNSKYKLLISEFITYAKVSRNKYIQLTKSKPIVFSKRIKRILKKIFK